MFHQMESPDRPSVHGMLIVGHSKIYLSHLPMFHSPHDYQVILEVEFSSLGKLAYLNSLQGPGESIYTLVPESFVLPDMIENPRPFTAQIYRGHFERGGQVIADKVQVKITKIIYFKKFRPGESQPELATYILFGNPEEQYLAHVIYASPDFDQILKVKIGANVSLDGTKIIRFENIPNADSLRAARKLEGTVLDSNEKIPIKTESSIYLETGDLT